MTVWDLEEARALVRTRYGREQFELARQSMGSTIDRREYARYHYHEAMRLLDERVGKLHSSASLVDIMLGCGDEDEQDEFHQCISEIGAHVTACIQSLHAIADIFAHAIYYALGYNLNSSPLQEKDIYLNSVKKQLDQTAQHKTLAHALDSLVSGGDFEYLNALANHSKHRSIIKPVLNVDFRDHTTPYCLKFPAIVYNEVSYPEVDAQEFMEQTYSILSPGVVKCGNAINAALARRLD